jgi:uncharacterized protein (TIGR00251 family)
VNEGQLRNVLREHPDGCTLAIRVQPGAKKSGFAGFYGEGSEIRIKVALQAPAIEGRANEALIVLLAEMFGLPRSAVTIEHGQTGRSKLVSLQGISIAEAQSRLRSRF